MNVPTPPNLLDAGGRYQGKAAGLAQTLVSVLTAQRGLYVELAGLAREQTRCITEGDAEPLMTVLAAKARLIEQLAPLDAQLQPYKNRWEATLATLSEADRQTVSTLLTQVQQLLADILEQDEADKQALIRQKTDVGGQLQRTVTGSQLNKAYGARPKGPAPGMGIG